MCPANHFIPPPPGSPKPVICEVTCPACGYQEQFKTSAINLGILSDLFNVFVRHPLAKDKIPNVCPKCGTKLNKKIIPIFINY